jgi:hypothetical protein
MSGTSGQLGYSSHLITTGGNYSLGAVGGQNATNNSLPALVGYLKRLLIGATDSAATTVIIYDSLSAVSANQIFKYVSASGGPIPQQFDLDIQLQNGLFVVVSGGSSPFITVVYG